MDFKKKILLLAAMSLMCLFVAGAAAEAASKPVRMPDGVVIPAAGGKLRVQVETDGIIRVRFAPGGEFSTRKSIITVEKKRSAPAWRMEENAGGISIITKRLRAKIDPGAGAVTFLDAKGGVLLRERADGGRETTPAIVLDENTYNVKQSFIVSPGEGLYGLGQYQDGVMNWRGHDVLIAQSNTISVVPFLYSTGGYGILWDNCSLSKFHDGADGMSMWSEVADGIDYYFVYGPSADGVIASYRELTGGAPMFAKWAYGYFQSKERYVSQDELISVVKEYRDRGLPLDVIVQDWMYWDKYGWNAMKFDERYFPDPAGLMKTLHDKYNAHIMISIWPKFGAETDVFKDMKSRGYLFGVPSAPDQGTFDAFNPAARALYWKYVNDTFFSKGMDAWWMDATEPEISSAKTQESTMAPIFEARKCALGTTARYLNAYSLMDTKGVYENQRKTSAAKRVFILTRSGFAGQQRNAAVTWSGDIEAEWAVLKNQIPAGLNFSMAGVPYWTTDTGA
ncbi:MAG TPA: glycoside hydrolase family 31 protein, partial [bacterium]|nr:glycoside hydrolase family 31 protein [bacterium]